VLRIAEIFTSIQGEGMWLGVPSVFIRVSGCNLRCKWCDTPYASWNPEGPVMSIPDILAAANSNVNHFVLTGGEPMLFEEIVPLASALKNAGKTITIETAGTVYRDLPCDLISISPKLANSTPTDTAWADRHDDVRWQPLVVRDLIHEYPYQLKFVVQSPDDIPEIDLMLEEIGPVDPHRVMLMAEGRDSVVLNERSNSLLEYAVARNWRLSPRWQIDLFGDTRGT
jgi:7-carboxy-7-deazaguanine synthase